MLSPRVYSSLVVLESVVVNTLELNFQFFISENPTSIEFEIRSSESQFSRINRAMLLTRVLYKKAESDYVCTPIMPSVLIE